MKAKEVMKVLNICRRTLAHYVKSTVCLAKKLKIKISNKIATDFIV